MSNRFRKYIQNLFEEVLDSYAILLFSGNRTIGFMLLLVSFFKPFAGFTALISAVIAIIFLNLTGIQRSPIHKGLFTYNAVLIGMGMGSLYMPSSAFWILLFLLLLLSVVLSAVLAKILSPKGLPFLTIPFVISFWLLVLVSREFTALHLSTRNIYWLNELFAYGGNWLVNFVQFFENLPLPTLWITFFKSLSCLIFQENVLAGLLIFFILVWHSRISASLAIIGFITGYLFSGLVLANDTESGYYLMNGNFILVSIAIGGFFLIPSFRSYLWVMLTVPCTFILMVAFGKIAGLLNLTTYSLPFSFTTILLIIFIQLIRTSSKLSITPQQFYSPEKNLYNYLNSSKRLFSERYLPLQLPFLGEWIVSQGYDSDITHKGEWSKALDFVIVDSQMKTYSTYAIQPENFYCYEKPVLAPAAGYVLEIIDHIEDNEIGKVNRKDNWGNTIVLSHGRGLYTKMSHLRKNSFKVKVGENVKAGDVLATCGNSGRSPEPHLHFQVQLTPYVGSKTFPYPFQSFMTRKDGKIKLVEFAVPQVTDSVSAVVVNKNIASAFEFIPGYRIKMSAESFDDQNWEVFTDEYNYTYFHCHQTGATAYFNRNQAFFYFTAFYGNRKSLLYLFYLSCYKVGFSTDSACIVHDEFPQQWTRTGISKWIQDLIAPFYIFRKLVFTSKTQVVEGSVFDPIITVSSETELQLLHTKQTYHQAEVRIQQNKIVSIEVSSHLRKIKIICKSND